ncbi:hypothetical protein ACHAWO_003871 [Cyclotella atomus]|uniref:Uncharacterized protein n=1 Tax=Cyclotella atomus TaxID=382360 RepID=A0ABD3MNW9_9STRA
MASTTTTAQAQGSGTWTGEENQKFFEAFILYGEGNWSKMATLIGTRTNTQVKSHAQKLSEAHPLEYEQLKRGEIPIVKWRRMEKKGTAKSNRNTKAELGCHDPRKPPPELLAAAVAPPRPHLTGGEVARIHFHMRDHAILSPTSSSDILDAVDVEANVSPVNVLIPVGFTESVPRKASTIPAIVLQVHMIKGDDVHGKKVNEILFAPTDFNNSAEYFIFPNGARRPIGRDRLLRTRLKQLLKSHWTSRWWVHNPSEKQDLEGFIAILFFMFESTEWRNQSYPCNIEEIADILEVIRLAIFLWYRMKMYFNATDYTIFGPDGIHRAIQVHNMVLLFIQYTQTIKRPLIVTEDDALMD